jgi:hypothetical protein
MGRAMRHPVTAGQFRVPISEIVFNPENSGPKTFQFRPNGQGDFRNPDLTGKFTAENNLAL